MKILVVVDSINIEDSSGSKANVALINNLADAGFDVLVYHCTRKRIQLKGINCFSILEKKLNLMYILSRSQRVFTRLTKINLAPFFEQLFGFSFTFFNDTNSIVTALKKCDYDPDLIMTLSKGASFRPHYAVLKMPELHRKWLAYVHDPYPFHYYPRPYNWIESSYKQKENFFIKVSEKAKFSAFPSQLLMEWMSSYFPNFAITGIIIPHQNADYNLAHANLPDFYDVSKFNLLHAGNLMKQRSPEGLLKGFMLFLEHNLEATTNSKLILLGNASDHAEMLSAYQIDHPAIYIYNGNIPFGIVYNLQKNVSVNIILESKSEISPFLPAKFPHCVQANKTIFSLAPYYSETRRLLGKNYRYWSEVDDVIKIASLIGEMYHLWKQNPQKFVLNRHDLEDYVSINYLKSLINNLDKN